MWAGFGLAQTMNAQVYLGVGLGWALIGLSLDFWIQVDFLEFMNNFEALSYYQMSTDIFFFIIII